MDIMVKAAVLAVDILLRIGRQEGMIEGRVESLFFLLGAFDMNPGQFLIPFFAGVADDFFKIPAGDFRIEILQGIGGTDIGNRNLDLNDFAGFGFVLGQETQVSSGRFPAAAESVIRVAVINNRLAVADNQGFIERPGIASGIIQVPFLGPAVDNMKTRDSGIIFNTYVRLGNLPASAAENMGQVCHNRGFVAGREGKAKDARTHTCRQFRSHAGFLELDPIVPGRGILIIVRKRRLIALFGVFFVAGDQFRLAHLRDKQEIA